MRRRALAIACLATLCVLTPALAQSPSDVSIKTTKGGLRTRIHCEWLEPKGDKSAHTSAVTAEEVMANDLENSAVFSLTRAWVPGQQPFDIQATVGGQWSVSGNTVKLTGEVRKDLDIVAAGEWFARMLFSLFGTPSSTLDMDDDEIVADFVRSHVVRGFTNDRVGRSR